MLDLRSIREDPEAARTALAPRGAADALDELLRLDERRRQILPQLGEWRARRTRVSEKTAQLKREGEAADEPIGEMRELGGAIKEREAELAEVESQREELAAMVPYLAESRGTARE